MLDLKCYAPCGFTQLCVIACPNNRRLGESAALVCSSDLELEDDTLPMRIEFADRSELRREDVDHSARG
jgi:hypothetical protein